MFMRTILLAQFSIEELNTNRIMLLYIFIIMFYLVAMVTSVLILHLLCFIYYKITCNNLNFIRKNVFHFIENCTFVV
ncbi:hypothetical protein KUTeg_009173 [Tegillarca granosa]|uniref:Uncharacterized protein n=1 Tax=Tegillarca granosa TaxID=220873 RepID=A0ABQ9FAK9_TEGGR|nr:hypothetical protein KUTeg_009173 [Tegillarca granosa]